MTIEQIQAEAQELRTALREVLGRLYNLDADLIEMVPLNAKTQDMENFVRLLAEKTAKEPKPADEQARDETPPSSPVLSEYFKNKYDGVPGKK
jgi:hypothetical protein